MNRNMAFFTHSIFTALVLPRDRGIARDDYFRMLLIESVGRSFFDPWVCVFLVSPHCCLIYPSVKRLAISRSNTDMPVCVCLHQGGYAQEIANHPCVVHSEFKGRRRDESFDSRRGE